MFMDVRMCECIVCIKEKLIKLKRVASGHQTFKNMSSCCSSDVAGVRMPTYATWEVRGRLKNVSNCCSTSCTRSKDAHLCYLVS
jgi:hypothetical protein